MMIRTSNRSALRLLVVVVALMTVTGAFAPAAAAQESPPTPPHNYYGTVTDQDGVAVADATVEVTYDGQVLASGTTDSNGDYDLKAPQENGVEDGDTVTISVAGATEERTWEPAGTTQVDFSVDPASTPGDGTPTPTPGTPTAAPGNGGGGGGGGGGGAPSGPSAVSGSGDVASDGRASVDLSGGQPVESVEVRLPVGTSGSVSVDELEELPAGVSETRGARMALVDIHAPDPGDGSAVVRLSVSKHVVDAYRASPEELTIEHYDEDAGEWETLDTSVASTSNSRVVLEAETSGFSLYAVTRGGAESVTTTATTPGDSTTDDSVTTTATSDGSTGDGTTDGTTTTTRPFPGFGPVVALVALLAVALLARRRA